jgi:hypothetical protein
MSFIKLACGQIAVEESGTIDLLRFPLTAPVRLFFELELEAHVTLEPSLLQELLPLIKRLPSDIFFLYVL